MRATWKFRCDSIGDTSNNRGFPIKDLLPSHDKNARSHSTPELRVDWFVFRRPIGSLVNKRGQILLFQHFYFDCAVLGCVTSAHSATWYSKFCPWYLRSIKSIKIIRWELLKRIDLIKINIYGWRVPITKIFALVLRRANSITCDQITACSSVWRSRNPKHTTGFSRLFRGGRCSKLALWQLQWSPHGAWRPRIALQKLQTLRSVRLHGLTLQVTKNPSIRQQRTQITKFIWVKTTSSFLSQALNLIR